MTPKEKAIELINKMMLDSKDRLYLRLSKQCALITVDEIMIAITYADYGLDYLNQVSYWEEVKQEISKI